VRGISKKYDVLRNVFRNVSVYNTTFQANIRLPESQQVTKARVHSGYVQATSRLVWPVSTDPPIFNVFFWSVLLLHHVHSLLRLVALSVQRLLRAARPRGRSSSLCRVKNFHFSVSFKLALGSTQPPIQWVPGCLSTG
jgi:hypothetical protein